MNSAESSYPTQSSIPLAYYQQGFGNNLRKELDLLALAQQPDLANQLNALAFAQNPQALLNLNGLQQSESPERLLMSLQSRNRQNDPMAGLIAMAQQPSNDPYAGRYQTSPMANQMFKSNNDLASQVSKLSMNQGNNQLNSIMQLLDSRDSQLLNQQSLNELLLLQQQMNNKNIRNTSNVQGYPYYMNFQNPNSLNGLLPNQSLYAGQNQLYYPQGPEIIDLENYTKRQLESQQLAFAKNTPENSLSALMTPEYEHLLKGLKQPAKNMEEIKFFANESLTSPSPQHSSHLYQKQQQQQQQQAINHQRQQQQMQQQQKQQQKQHQQQLQQQQQQLQLQQQLQQQQQQLLINQQKQLQSLQTPPPKEVKTAMQSQVATPQSQSHGQEKPQVQPQVQAQEKPQPQVVQIQDKQEKQEKQEKLEKLEKPQVQPQIQPQVSKPKPAPIEITVIDENDEPTQASPKETKEPQSAGMAIESSAVETKESSTASGGESQIEVNAKKNTPVKLPIVTPVILPVNPNPLTVPLAVPITVPLNLPVSVSVPIATPTILTPAVNIPAPLNLNIAVPTANTNANKCFNRLCQTDVNNEMLWAKQKLNNHVICKNCLNSYNKGNFCCFCKQIYPDEETTTASNDDKEWIECEACKTWNHIDCETLHGLRELPLLLSRDKDYKYYCPDCKGNRIVVPRSPRANGKNSAKNSHSKPSSPSAITLESETQSIKNTTILHPRPPLDDSLIADEGLKEPIVKKLKVVDPIRTPIIEQPARVLDSEDIDRGNFAKKKLDNMFNRSSFNKKRFSNKVYITPLESGFYIEKLLGQYGGKKLQLSDSEIRGDLEVFRGLCGLKDTREEENNKGGFHINPASLSKERGLNPSGRGRGAGRGRKSAFSSRPRANDDGLGDGGSDVNEGSENMGFYESSTRTIRNKKKFD